MRVLFIHQNFPGQFRHLARALAEQPDCEVVGVGDAANVRPETRQQTWLRVLTYSTDNAPDSTTHRYLKDYEGHVRRGQTVARLLLKLRDEDGWVPDLVVAHPGWGEGLFVRDIFPDAHHVQYFEYYYRADGGDVDFDPEFPATLDDRLRVRIKNSTQLQSLVACDSGISPTAWQRSRYPEALQAQIEVIHDGIDTLRVCPDQNAWVELDGRRLSAGDEVVTYVARNLEPYRGFHTFLRALPRLQALRPDATVLVVGADGVSYGKRLPEGDTYSARYRAELGDTVDWERVMFLGSMPYADYLRVLQISAVHVYLTYPFVLSWSLLEAMAAGCLLVASDTAPVREVLTHEQNGLLVDFFNADALAVTVAEALAAGSAREPLRAAARRTIVERYDLHTVCLPRQLQHLRALDARR